MAHVLSVAERALRVANDVCILAVGVFFDPLQTSIEGREGGGAPLKNPFADVENKGLGDDEAKMLADMIHYRT